ncbi:MAG: hypothetical protein AAGJ28_21830 [Pseudomonadota bacterium]
MLHGSFNIWRDLCDVMARCTAARLNAVGWPLTRPLVNLRQTTRSSAYQARGVLRDRVLRSGAPFPEAAAAARRFRLVVALSYALLLGGLFVAAQGWGDPRYITAASWALVLVPLVRLIPIVIVRRWPVVD